jgi:hypothetical protein
MARQAASFFNIVVDTHRDNQTCKKLLCNFYKLAKNAEKPDGDRSCTMVYCCNWLSEVFVPLFLNLSQKTDPVQTATAREIWPESK